MNAKGRSVFRLLAALGLLSFSGLAVAVPLRFDFSGTVRETNVFNFGINTPDHTNDGASFTASILIETSGLTKSTSVSSVGTQVQYLDAPAAPEWVMSSVMIAGVSYDVGIYGFDRGGISFLDSAGPQPVGCTFPNCSGSAPDQFSVFDSSTESLFGLVPSPFPGDGVYRTRSLSLNSSDPDFSPFNPALSMDYFDLTATDSPLSAVTLPLGFLGGHYSESHLTCTSGPTRRCVGDYNRVTVFSITQITRSIVSVPEPASAALFAFGMLGLAIRRRRKMG
jgi:hypothetical protein